MNSLLNLFCLFTVKSVLIPDTEEIKNIYIEYLDAINHVITDNEYSENKTFLKDTQINIKNLINKIKDKNENTNEKLEKKNDFSELNKIICVLDVGGSFFKIAYVSISVINEKLDYDIIRKKEIKYPEKTSYTSLMFWFDWVAKIFVNDYIDHKITPDSISLIFSYPVRYEENFAYPVKFSKFWCFEEKTSLNLNIKAYLKSAIKEKIENYIFLSENIINQNKNTATDELNSTKLSENDNYNLNNIVNENRFSKSLKVNSVLNDSVATFFASKFIDNSKSIGIILGTGTNGSFCINDYYIFNSEWGNFKPKSLKLMKEEELVLSQQKDHCNFLDVICGNGYKSRILSNLLENENHYITHENLDLASILKENIDDKCKRLLLELIERSSKILSALICAVIKKYNSSNINIILNGSGFSQDNQRFNFIAILKETLERLELKNMNLNIIYEEGLTFVGAAYYEYCNFFN